MQYMELLWYYASVEVYTTTLIYAGQGSPVRLPEHGTNQV